MRPALLFLAVTMLSANGFSQTPEPLKCEPVVPLTSDKDASRSAGPAQAASCSGFGEQKTAVILAHFPGTTPPNLNLNAIRQYFFGTGKSLDAYWREASYGQTWATGDVFGWVTLDRVYQCAESQPLILAAIRAADHLLDFRNYTRVALVLPGSNCGENAAGFPCLTWQSPSKGGFTASVTYLRADDLTSNDLVLRLSAHELGHTLGLGHSQTMYFPSIPLGPLLSPGTLTEYGNTFSAMGSGNGLYEAHHRSRLGWLTTANGLATVEASGSFALLPLASQASGLKALRVRRGPGNDAWLWIEYRQPIGAFDAALPPQAFSGALIYYEDATNILKTRLLDFNPTGTADDFTLLAGQTWRDPFTPLFLTVNSATSAGINVSVGYDPLCAAIQTTSKQHTSAAETGSVSVDASAGCQWTATVSDSWIQITAGASGSGNGTVSYSVAANPSTSTERKGTIAIGRRTYAVTQEFKPSSPPTVTSVTPLSGSGQSQIFTLIGADSEGAEDISSLDLSFSHGTLVCHINASIVGSRLLLSLAPDGGSGTYHGPVEPGMNSSIENSQCRVTDIGAAMSKSGTNVTISIPVAFKPAFAGNASVKARASDFVHFGRPMLTFGSWAIPACLPAISSGAALLTAAAQSATVLVAAPTDCQWIASAGASWVAITAGASGTGYGTVGYSVTQNPGSNSRATALNIGGNTFIVTQSPAPCRAAIQPPSVNVPGNAKTAGAFSLTFTSPGCAWSASSNASWLQVNPLAGTGAQQVEYTVFPHFGTASRTGAITVAGQTFTVNQAAANATADWRFVAFTYFAAFGRYPSSAEISFQLSNALMMGVTREELFKRFFDSVEFNNAGRFVSGLYVGLLDRDPEFGGWLFQRNAIASNIVTQDDLVRNFMASPEYTLKYGSPSNAQFVRLLYRHVLLREPSDAEVAAQVSALGDGSEPRRLTMARAFLNAAEFQQGTQSRLNAFLLYALILQRDATAPDRLFHASRLDAGLPLLDLIRSFINSQEFLQILM